MPKEQDYLEGAPEDGTTPEGPEEEVVESEEVEEDGGEPKEPDYEKMFLDTKRAYTESRVEAAQLRGRLEALENQLRAGQQEEEKDWLEELDDDELRDDPAKTKEAIRRAREEFATVLRQQHDYFMRQIQESNSEVKQYREKINELKSDEAFSGLTDEQALAILKREESLQPKAKRAPTPPVSKRTPTSQSQKDPRKSDLFKKLYPEIAAEMEKNNAS